MTVHDPYGLLKQGYGLMAWNANVQQLMKVGQRFESNGMQLEVTAVSGVLHFSTGPYQRVHVKLIKEAV